MSALETDVHLHQALAEALKEIANGEELLQLAVRGYESIKLDLVFDAVDKFRRAVDLARGKDTEIVCMAYTKIAYVYLKVFKDCIHKTKARETLADVMNYSQVRSDIVFRSWHKMGLQVSLDNCFR